jgi:hypothetical protein
MKKTLHELAKEFPEKTYRELEKYRDEDRQKEAQQIPLTESQKAQEELEPIEKGVCVIGEARKDREETFEPKLEEQVEALKKELDLERECSQAGYLENKKLHKEVRELKHDNKQLAKEIEGRVNHLRKSGL